MIESDKLFRHIESKSVFKGIDRKDRGIINPNENDKAKIIPKVTPDKKSVIKP